MADEQEIEIEVTDEAQSAPPEVKEEKAADPVAELQSQLETIKAEKQREAEARADADRRAQAERAAREAAERDADTARSQATDTRLTSYDSMILAQKAEADAAEKEFLAAAEQGDFKRQAEAMRRVQRAEAQIGLLERDKMGEELQKTSPQQQQREAPPRQVDPVEAFMAGRDQQTAAWLRAHPDDARALALASVNQGTLEQQRRAAKINAAHNDALSEGYSAGSADYFRYVEGFLGMNKKEESTPAPKTAVMPKKPSTPVAPVAAGDGGVISGSNGTGAGVVKLSQREATAATDGTHVWNYDDTSGKKMFKKGDPIGVQEFARRKREMMKQGLYDKSWTEQ